MAAEKAGPDGSSSAARLASAVQRLDRLVDWEKRDRDASMRRSTAPIANLCRRLGHPQNAFRCVHVAGTKGKGTTSALIAAGLQAAGWRTGLYTSPHVVTLEERIRIDGGNIGALELAQALDDVLGAREQAQHDGDAAAESTWFDCLTAAAFVAFRTARIDWAVLECGLGGRLDSTNVAYGQVAVITNIDLEHTNVLGSTRAAIAREKAGIVKMGSVLVTGVLPGAPPGSDDDAAGVIDAWANVVGVEVVRPSPLAPTLLERNVQLARMALDELGRSGVTLRAKVPEVIVDPAGTPLTGAGPGWVPHPDDRVSGRLLTPEWVQSARLPGRMERLKLGSTHIVLDAAHVPSSVRQVLGELASDPELPGKPFCILALGRDKDARGILKELAGAVDSLVCTTVASGPLVDAESLVREAAHFGIVAEKAIDPAQALARALHNAGTRGWILVIGSFYLAGAVHKELRSRETP